MEKIRAGEYCPIHHIFFLHLSLQKPLDPECTVTFRNDPKDFPFSPPTQEDYRIINMRQIPVLPFLGPMPWLLALGTGG